MARLVFEQSGAEALVAMFQHIDEHPARNADVSKRMLLTCLARLAQWDGSHECRFTSGFHVIAGQTPIAWTMWKDDPEKPDSRGTRVMNGEIVLHGDGEVLSHT